MSTIRLRTLTLALAVCAAWCAAMPAAAADRSVTGAFAVSFGHVPDDLKVWAEAVARRAPRWAVEIGRRLPPRTPIGKVKILIDEDDGFVAFGTGRTIVVSAPYLRKAPDDIGVIGHELVHMFQDYPAGSVGWVVEGLADYLRYYVLEPGTSRGRFDPAEANYRGGYQAAAWLLRHVESRLGCAVIISLHAAMRGGTYDDNFWVRETGLPPDALWSRARAVAGRQPRALNQASRC